MSAARDPYEVLGVPRTASTRQIRAAYVARARRAHPDLVGQRGLDVMRALNEAWAILKDDARRQEFDLATGGAGGSAAPDGSAAGSGGPSTGPRRDDPNAPFWTGANGAPPGRAYGSVLDFGIYAGWSLGEIFRRDRGYLMWLRDRSEGDAYRTEIAKMLNPEAEEAPDPHRDKRRR